MEHAGCKNRGAYKREHCSTERIFIYPQSRAGSLGTCFNFLFSNGFLICIRSSQLELLRFGRRVFHGNVARGTTKPNRKKINSFHATYSNSPHVHLLDFPLYGGFFFLSEHLFYILDKLIIITLFNFTRLNTPPFLVFELGMLNFDLYA